jgi:hypothetical protein
LGKLVVDPGNFVPHFKRVVFKGFMSRSMLERLPVGRVQAAISSWACVTNETMFPLQKIHIHLLLPGIFCFQFALVLSLFILP